MNCHIPSRISVSQGKSLHSKCKCVIDEQSKQDCIGNAIKSHWANSHWKE